MLHREVLSWAVVGMVNCLFFILDCSPPLLPGKKEGGARILRILLPPQDIEIIILKKYKILKKHQKSKTFSASGFSYEYSVDNISSSVFIPKCSVSCPYSQPRSSVALSLSLCLFVSLPVSLLLCLFVSLPAALSLYLSISLSLYLFVTLLLCPLLSNPLARTNPRLPIPPQIPPHSRSQPHPPSPIPSLR
jgi:hypothetical protein